jgi:hypothetical protein
MTRKIRTVRDSRLEKYYADLNREAAIDRRILRTKIRRWERKVEEFGGEFHINTLARLKARLEAIT